jgi:hypothetical protein
MTSQLLLSWPNALRPKLAQHLAQRTEAQVPTTGKCQFHESSDMCVYHAYYFWIPNFLHLALFGADFSQC